MTTICAELQQLPQDWGGEFCSCIRPAVHVFGAAHDEHGLDSRAHHCSCGSWWYDDQQVDEAQRMRTGGN